MSTSPKVCVATTVKGNLLPTTQTSVLQQSYSNAAHVILDDPVSLTAPRLDGATRRLAIPSLGIGMAHDIATHLCPTDARYLAFVDADDWLRPEFLERTVALLEETSADIVTVNYEAEHAFDHNFPNRTVVDNDVARLLAQRPAASPPWRSVYRASSWKACDLRMPALDVFYTDNILQWRTLTCLRRHAFLTDRLVHHASSRTVANLHERLGMARVAHYVNATIIAKTTDAHVAYASWLEQLRRFISPGQPNHAAYLNAIAAMPPNTRLDIVIPARNVARNLQRLLPPLVADRSLRVIVACSTVSVDRTCEVAEAISGTIVVRSTRLHAGELRNHGMSVLQSRYVFCLDADDEVDLPNLHDAVDVAHEGDGVDVVLMAYRNRDAQRYWPMAREEQQRWREATDTAALRVIAYPWNRLVSTSLVRSHDVTFSNTKVHNDILYHWSTIGFARSVRFYERPVVTHVFSHSHRKQLSADHTSRSDIITALAQTHYVLVRNGLFRTDAMVEAFGNMTVEVLRWNRQQHRYVWRTSDALKGCLRNRTDAFACMWGISEPVESAIRRL